MYVCVEKKSIEVGRCFANLLIDFAFKYVFGEDCKEANDALKSLLTVFSERKVHHVDVKNSDMVKDYSKMKNSRLN